MANRSELDSRLNGLDTLRALAIVLVYAFHYAVFVSHEATFGWLSDVGWVGVDLFFVLSGYLISNQILEGLVTGQQLSLRHFFARRALRTLPAYLVVLALYRWWPEQLGGATAAPVWRFLTFTQNFGLRAGTAFSHAWSLCVEEQFYVVLPLAAVFFTQRRWPPRVAWVTMGLLTLGAVLTRSVLWQRYATDPREYTTHIYYSSWCRGDEFLPGVALALLKHAHPRQWAALMERGRTLFAVAMVSAGVLGWLILTSYSTDSGYPYFMTGFGYSLIAWGCALLTLAAMSPTSWLARVRIPGASAIATSSYSIYLTHKAIGVLLSRALPSASGWGPVLLIAGASMLGGGLLYALVERPGMRLRARFAPRLFARSAR